MSNNKQSSVDKEFVPYEEALALKELGFDEPCFAIYVDKQLQINATYQNHLEFKGWVAAPTFSQAFRWFREKYDLIGEIFSQLRPSNKFMYGFKIGGSDIIFDGFYTYEEAELECLRKLIETVKEKGV